MNYENEHAFKVMKDELRLFGKKYIEYARNRTIDTIKRDINGECTSPKSIELRKLLESFSPDQIDTLMQYVYRAVSNCMFNTMIMIEESDDIRLLVKSENGDKEIREISDGLGGDLFSWIEWYSKE